jgi:hypothetical protein
VLVYRLVDEAHDSITVGRQLTRTSDKSNQKLGRGMYFLESVADATKFGPTPHKHSYTHLLTVEITQSLTDFADLRSAPGQVEKWLGEEVAAGRLTPSDLGTLTVHDKHTRYCAAGRFVGFHWSPRQANPWTELVVLEQNMPPYPVIVAARPYP